MALTIGGSFKRAGGGFVGKGWVQYGGQVQQATVPALTCHIKGTGPEGPGLRLNSSSSLQLTPGDNRDFGEKGILVLEKRNC